MITCRSQDLNKVEGACCSGHVSGCRLAVESQLSHVLFYRTLCCYVDQMIAYHQ